MGSAMAAMHGFTALRWWAVELQQWWALQLVQCTASPLEGSGQWNFGNVVPHCLGAVGSGSPAMQCLSAWRPWRSG